MTKIFGHDVLKQVAKDHKTSVSALRGQQKFPWLVAARRDAIARLLAAEFPVAKIARVMNRDHSTICHHMYPQYRVRKAAWARRYGTRQQEALA